MLLLQYIAVALYMEERERIGRKIADLRTAAGMTQEKLAELSEVGASHIARIEKGRYSVGIDVLSKIAGVFGKKIDIV